MAIVKNQRCTHLSKSFAASRNFPSQGQDVSLFLHLAVPRGARERTVAYTVIKPSVTVPKAVSVLGTLRVLALAWSIPIRSERILKSIRTDLDSFPLERQICSGGATLAAKVWPFQWRRDEWSLGDTKTRTKFNLMVTEAVIPLRRGPVVRA